MLGISINGSRNIEEFSEEISNFPHLGDFNLMTLGFIFRNNRTEVALIQKSRPEWQKDKLNGIGGKANKDETPLACIRRECLEECGLNISDWKISTILAGDKCDWAVVVFYTDLQPDQPSNLVNSDSTEPVKWVTVTDLPKMHTLDNIQWLIPMIIYDKNIGMNMAIYQ